jgi:hypothetical protein
MARYRTSIHTAVVVALLVATALPAVAGEYYDIVLANRIIGRLRDPGPYGSISARGSQVEKNIVEALSVEEVGTPKMWTKMEDGLPSIYIGGTFLVQVQPGDVTSRGASTKTVARQWLAGFEQQFPRAEPVTKMGSSDGGGSAASSGSGSSGPKPPPKTEIVVPDEDRELVGSVQTMIADTRTLEGEDFEAKAPGLATELATLIWRTHPDPTCEQLSELDGADKAVYSALNGIRYGRDLEEEDFHAKKTTIAYTVVKRVRAALATAS